MISQVKLWLRKNTIYGQRNSTIIHWTHYLLSDWLKMYREFSKSVPLASFLHIKVMNNQVKFARFVLLAIREEVKTWLLFFFFFFSRASSFVIVHNLFFLYFFNFLNITFFNSLPTKTWLLFFCSVYNKTIIIRFSFCDIQNNQGLFSRSFQLQRITPTSTLIILDITKTLSNYCF